VDIPGQEAILLGEHDAAGGAPEVEIGCGWVHVLAIAFFRISYIYGNKKMITML
jgi:hypothetical protein